MFIFCDRGWSLGSLTCQTGVSPFQQCIKSIRDGLESYDHWKSSIQCWLELERRRWTSCGQCHWLVRYDNMAKRKAWLCNWIRSDLPSIDCSVIEGSCSRFVKARYRTILVCCPRHRTRWTTAVYWIYETRRLFAYWIKKGTRSFLLKPVKWRRRRHVLPSL